MSSDNDCLISNYKRLTYLRITIRSLLYVGGSLSAIIIRVIIIIQFLQPLNCRRIARTDSKCLPVGMQSLQPLIHASMCGGLAGMELWIPVYVEASSKVKQAMPQVLSIPAKITTDACACAYHCVHEMNNSLSRQFSCHS